MTIIEKKSLRKKKAILSLVEKGEYSVGYALMLVEDLSDSGKLTDSDYEELAEYLENLLESEQEQEQEQEQVEDVVDEPVEND